MSNETGHHAATRSVSAGAVHVSPYETTKTGLIGEQRDSMLQSELQILVSRPSDLDDEWHRSHLFSV